MSEYLPEQMLNKKKEIERSLTKDEQQEARKLSYLNSLKSQEEYAASNSASKRLSPVFDRTRSSLISPMKPAFKAEAILRKLRSLKKEKALRISSDPTEFTLEIYDQIRSIDDVTSTDYIAIHTASHGGLVGHLSSVRFTPEMMFPSVIRANFTRYMTLVREWERYNATDEGQDPDLSDEMEEMFELFYKRMNLYCRENRINLDGTPMKKGEEVAPTEKMSRDEIEEFSEKADSFSESAEKTVEEERELTPIVLSAAELEQAEKEPGPEDIPKEKDIVAFIDSIKEMTPKERALNRPAMAALDEKIKEAIKDIDDPAEKAILKKTETSLSLWIAFTDLQIGLSKEPTDERLRRLLAAGYKDLMAMEKRNTADDGGDIPENPSDGDDGDPAEDQKAIKEAEDVREYERGSGTENTSEHDADTDSDTSDNDT